MKLVQGPARLVDTCLERLIPGWQSMLFGESEEAGPVRLGNEVVRVLVLFGWLPGLATVRLT